MTDAAMESAKLRLKLKRESERNRKQMETKTTTAIVPAANGANNMTALQVVQNMDAVTKLGQVYAASGFFGAVTASTATASIINAALEGISPLEYRAKYHTFEDGTTSVKSDYIQREFHRLGGEWDFKEWTPEVCDMIFTYKGKTLPMRVTIDEFKANKVAVGKDGKTLKANWAKFPREMLKARCMATAIRAICPEALGGMYTQEEVADLDRFPRGPLSVKTSPSPIAEPNQEVKECAPLSIEAVKAEVVDYAVCPCGKSKGKRFDELPTDTLLAIVNADEKKFPLVTPEHRNAIVAILGERDAAGGKSK